MPPNNFNMNPNPMNPVPTPPPVMPTPSSIPPIPNKSGGESDTKMKTSIGILFLVIIIALAYLGYSKYPNLFKKTNLSTGNETVEKTDFSKVENLGKLPSGFPANIPVEKNNLTESTKITYPEQKSVLYSVSFNSFVQPEMLYYQYKNFLSKENSFVIDSQAKTIEKMFFQATKVGTRDSLSIVITPTNAKGMSFVQIAYVSRQ